VQRLLQGESLEALSRELNVPAHRLSDWRDRVLIAAESALKERERDARDEDIARRSAKVGEITMANELLYSKIDRLEAGRPLAGRRSRR
jgi:transposase